MEKHKVLELLLEELQRFLKLLDAESLSSSTTVQKGLLTDLLLSYTASDNGGDEEYIYMNKVSVTGQGQDKTDRAFLPDHRPEADANGRSGKHVPAPQKSLPDLPPPRTAIVWREPFPLPSVPVPQDSPEGYYEEAQPYETTINDLGCFGIISGTRTVWSSDSVIYAVITQDDGEAVSSSYESYDEEEVTKGKSTAQHQWPSPEASIELVRDARICAFLWRKKWLGQWAKQLCIIRENRLLCYKSSKEQTPLLDVSLLGCSVIYKEKQPKKKEHKLKIIPLGGEAIVLGLQSKEQTEQWLKVIQEISPKSTEGSEVTDSPRLICTKGELSERYSVASESGSSTDSHAETVETKDVKKKYGSGLKFSNLMNIGKKKTSSLENPEKSVNTSGYLNVLVNSHWRSRYCLIKDGQLMLYQDKGKSKLSQQPVALEGCMVVPDPSPEHLYSFRIQMDGEELATLEAKSSADMGHWLGLLLSQTGIKTDPEELAYDYVNSERISSIVNAAKTSMYLMQRRYSEPNTYTDRPPSDPNASDDIYDDVPSTENEQEEGEEQSGGGEAVASVRAEQDGKDRVYLDLIPIPVPVRSFLHTAGGRGSPQTPPPLPADPAEEPQDTQNQDVSASQSVYESTLPTLPSESVEPTPATPGVGSDPPASPRVGLDLPASPNLRVQTQPQKISFPSQEGPRRASPGTPPTQSPSSPQSQPHTPQSLYAPSHTPQSLYAPSHTPQSLYSPSHTPQSLYSPSHTPQSPQASRRRTASTDRVKTSTAEVKLGKNRTEADVRLFTDERDRLEREREEVKDSLASLRKERREAKEELSTSSDPRQQASLEACVRQREEACREAERRRVEVELRLMEVKESLRKVEAGPFTLGTTVDTSLLDPPTPKAACLSPPATPASPTNNGEASPVNSATALKNRPLSIMQAPNKGNVMAKAKEWEKKSTT